MSRTQLTPQTATSRTTTSPVSPASARTPYGKICAFVIAMIFALTAPALAQQDCNANGMDDTIDLSNGTSQDGDGNGVPDECQGYIEQLDFIDGDGLPLPLGQNSQYGRATIEYQVAPDVLWGQMIVNGQWVVRNLPLMPLAPLGDMHEASVQFDLPLPPGQDLPGANVYTEITPIQLDPLGPMPLGQPLPLPVQDAIITQGGTKEEGPTIWSPDLSTPPGNFFLAANFLNWEMNLRPGMPNMNVKVNHCAPGAVANSLECLKQRFCLPVGQTITEMYDKLRGAGYMNTSKANGTIVARFLGGNLVANSNDALKGVQNFINQKGLADKVTVLGNGPWYGGAAFDPNQVHTWMQAGYDVTLDYGYTTGGGHTVVVAGTIKCGNQICIVVRSDHEQDLNTYQAPGDPGQRTGGVSKWDVHCFKAIAGGKYELTNEAGNEVRGAIALCPVQPRGDDCVSSSSLVDWSPAHWTKNGQVIGVTFPNGVVTGPGASEAYDSVPLPVWPNDWHWDAIVDVAGQPKHLQVDMVNFGNEDLAVEIIAAQQFPFLALFVDVGADLYFLEAPGLPPLMGQWSLYPSDIPPSLGIQQVGANRARAAAPVTTGQQFLRGDCNNDGALNVGDPVRLLTYLFSVGATPPDCLSSCDANDDGALNIADSVALLAFLFPTTPNPQPIAAPFDACGGDPTQDSLQCEFFGTCP